MSDPTFIDGRDATTYSPFVLIDCRDTEWADLRLEFSDHEWRDQNIGGDHIGECYLNGYGIQGMVIAARMLAGLEPVPDSMELNSEADTCYIHFPDLAMAVETASLAHQMIHDSANREKCAKLSVEEGLDDM
jgi:hypothetical protein